MFGDLLTAIDSRTVFDGQGRTLETETVKDALWSLDPGRASRVRLGNWILEGDLDLTLYPGSLHSLEFTNCTFLGEVILEEASFRRLLVTHCTFERDLRGQGLEVQGQCVLQKTFKGIVDLPNATFAGGVSFEGSQFLFSSESKAKDLAGSPPDFDDSAYEEWLGTNGSRAREYAALNLEGALCRGGSLNLDQIQAEGVLNLRSAVEGQLMLNRAALQDRCLSLDAGRLICGSLFMGCGFAAAGKVSLDGAKVTGSVEMDSAKLSGCSDSLSAENLEVGGDLFLRSFEAAGGISLHSAKVKGNVEMDAATLNGSSYSLIAENLEVGGALFMRVGFEAAGTVNLHGAKVAGSVVMDTAKLNCYSDSLIAENLEVGGSLFMRNVEAASGVSLYGATVKGNVEMERSTLNGSSYSLIAENMEVGGALNMRDGFEAAGKVSLHGAKVAGSVFLEGASLNGPSESLIAENLEVGGALFIRDGFVAAGEVSLHGAKVKGNVELDTARLNGSIDSLIAENLEIGGALYMRSSFEAAGRVSLLGAKVSGSVEIDAAKVGGALVANNLKVDSDWKVTCSDFEALDAAGCVVRGSLLFVDPPSTVHLRADFSHIQVGRKMELQLSTQPGAKIELDFAEVKERLSVVIYAEPTESPNHPIVSLRQSVCGSWSPPRGWNKDRTVRWMLQGFRYQGIELLPEGSHPQQMASFLDRADEGRFFPQPFQQLIKALKAEGYSDQAIELDKTARRIDLRHRKGSPLGWARAKVQWFFLDLLMGYGHNIFRLGWPALGLCLLGSTLFWINSSDMLPLNPIEKRASGQSLDPAATQGSFKFHPSIYTLDVLLPVVDLQQERNFAPNPTGRSYVWLSFGFWFLQISGWILSLLLLIGLSGVVKKSGPTVD